MKLFTKDLDKQLFAQYPKGNDLDNQMVVAKIFNPYGRGTWYLLNSDPEDPDYIWAIVDLFEVEVGSVSRMELESIKVPPFGLHLERDMYFTPINASELLRGLQEGKMYEKGGETNSDEYDNKKMLLNLVETMEHHVEELEEAVEKKDKIESWVLAKGQRAVTDLQDITHYVDSKNEIKIEEKEGEEEYAHGGELKWQDAQLGDSALVISENKMGVIIKPYGRKFHLKFVDGTEKTYDASELKFFGDIDDFDRGGKMAYGGMIAGRWYKDKSGQEFKYIGKIDSGVNKGKLFVSDGSKSLYKDVEDFDTHPKENKLFGFFAEGGEIKKGDFVIVDNPHWKASMGVEKPVKRKVSFVDSENVFFADGSNSSLKYVKKMAEGGIIDEIKQFEKYNYPKPKEKGDRVRAIFEHLSKKGYSKEEINKALSEMKYAEGGEVKFADKVKSIKASLLKRKKVPKAVQKDYGKTFSPKEAEDSAKRIVGAQTARERLMMRMGKKKKK